MANTFKVSKLTQVHANSQDSTTGEITTKDISADDTELNVEIADAETDPDGATFFTVSRLTGTLGIDDYDFCFVDSLDNGSTLEEEMASRNKVFVQLVLEGGTLQDGNGNTWFEVRPVVMPAMEVGTDDDLVTGMLEFTHSDHDGVQRPA
jgi:hypothetical protein